MKAFTDISQSKKLAEILPHESADMYYLYDIPYAIPYKNRIDVATPCWSLAALLDVIPKYIGGSELRIDKGENDFSLWYDEVDAILPDITANNSVDACYEMISELHEQKLL